MPFDGRRVLLVEDEFLAALTTIDLLESIGWEVVGPTARLASALLLARSEPLDAAVLDINVAGEMIWPVAETLRLRGVPFVFLSALSARNAIPPLFADVPRLAKPLEQSHFLHRLDEICGDDPARRLSTPLRKPHASRGERASNPTALYQWELRGRVRPASVGR